ncbi:Os09g0295200 [Oryza sativa Japonica Group]|uniref:Os09g0295200 protein n=1 Tax=Oryza sativa subsp. japonica TaxID=39947 RepID=Q0J2V4_ORYSJ|nr:Os09g0295200 [Oryza sativa Japonica Group]|eukprot:NP_001062797.1 Os09g0295200 [Oryza sativa Japonica Group]
MHAGCMHLPLCWGVRFFFLARTYDDKHFRKEGEKKKRERKLLTGGPQHTTISQFLDLIQILIFRSPYLLKYKTNSSETWTKILLKSFSIF